MHLFKGSPSWMEFLTPHLFIHFHICYFDISFAIERLNNGCGASMISSCWWALGIVVTSTPHRSSLSHRSKRIKKDQGWQQRFTKWLKRPNLVAADILLLCDNLLSKVLDGQWGWGDYLFSHSIFFFNCKNRFSLDGPCSRLPFLFDRSLLDPFIFDGSGVLLCGLSHSHLQKGRTRVRLFFFFLSQVHVRCRMTDAFLLSCHVSQYLIMRIKNRWTKAYTKGRLGIIAARSRLSFFKQPGGSATAMIIFWMLWRQTRAICLQPVDLPRFICVDWCRSFLSMQGSLRWGLQIEQVQAR